MKKILIAGTVQNTQNYASILRHLNAFPIISLSPESIYSFDGLVLPGGGDLCPTFFSQPFIDTRNSDPLLDRAQFHLLYQFYHARKPILGICKGMQMMNVFFGGDLKQHLDSENLHQWNGHDQWHPTIAQKGTFLEKIYGSSFEVNSAHHQCISTPGQGFNIIQYALDGTPEGLMHERLPIFAVQWHPERMCLRHKKYGAPDGTAIFYVFLNSTSVLSD